MITLYLTVIPLKSDRLRAADEINTTLWHCPSLGSSGLWILPLSLLISLKRDTMDHPPLFLNNCQIAEVSSLKVFGFMLDSSFTWGLMLT